MLKKYSPSAQGFYLVNPPDDAFEVTADQEDAIHVALAMYSAVVSDGTGGLTITPRASTSPEAWAQHQALAQAALDASDMTALRCMKAGVAFPAAWLAYCQALRAIVAAATGDPSVALPTMPAYPAGT